MTASIVIPPKIQFIDGTGQPIVGGYVYTLDKTLSTPKDSYVDALAVTKNTNPVELDASGRASIWMTGEYGLRVTDANDVLVYEQTNITAYSTLQLDGLLADVDDLNSTITSCILVAIDYTIQLADRCKTILVNANSGDVNISLLAASALGNKWRACIKKVDFSDNVVNIIPDGADTIDQLEEWTLYNFGDFIEILCDGNYFHIVSSQARGAFVDLSSNAVLDLSYNNKTVFCDVSVASFIISLPPISDVGSGFEVAFKTGAMSSNTVTINPNGADKIDGEDSYVLGSGYDCITIKTNLAKGNWFITNNSMTSGTPTGDVKQSFNPLQAGWLKIEVDDRTIGDLSSGAYYANDIYYDLFVLFWNQLDDTKCPVSGGRGASADIDWSAHKTLKLPWLTGRVLGVAGSGSTFTTRLLGDTTGEEKHAQNWNELATHTHLYGNVVNGDGGSWGHMVCTDPHNTGVDNAGSSTPFNIMQPTSFLYTFIKL